MAEPKLDIFPHILPRPFFERMTVIAREKPALAASMRRWLDIPVLWDLEARMAMMSRFRGYTQITSVRSGRSVSRMFHPGL